MKAVMRDKEELKFSEIEWIGQIPQHWHTKNIKYHFDVIAGATPDSKNPEYWDGDITWVTPADYRTEDKYVKHGKRSLSLAGYQACSASLTPKGSIIFSKRAPIGTVALSTTELCTNQGCLACVPKASVNSTYYYYVMSIATEEFELKGSGTTFKEISANNFLNTKLPCPSYEEQQVIANYLDDRCAKIDAVIAEAKASIEEYKELRYATISDIMKKGFTPKKELKDSGIEWFGKIPADTEIVKMKNVATIVDCKNRTADNILDGEYTVVRTSCIKDGKFSLIGSYSTNKDNYLEWTERGKPQEGDIFFTREAPAGEACLVPDMDNICMGQRVMYFRPNKDMDSLYILYSIYSELCRVYIDKRTKGSTVGHLKLGDVDCLPIIKRPIDEQKEISAFLRDRLISIDGLISEKQSLIEDLESYKKSLIYEIVTGKRKVVA